MSHTMLKPLSAEDAEMILSWRNAPEVRKNMYSTHEISMEEHLAWFANISDDKSKRYFVFYRDDSPVGVIGFSEINQVKGIATWAFYADPSAPRGSGSLMEYYALEYAFHELALHKLRCEVLEFNKPVVKLHQKFGFTVEGVHRDAYFDGASYHNVVHLGILANEWTEHQPLMMKKLRIK